MRSLLLKVLSQVSLRLAVVIELPASLGPIVHQDVKGEGHIPLVLLAIHGAKGLRHVFLHVYHPFHAGRDQRHLSEVSVIKVTDLYLAVLLKLPVVDLDDFKGVCSLLSEVNVLVGWVFLESLAQGSVLD